MRLVVSESGFQVWISAQETADWARRPGESWPCSFLAGRRVFAEFDSGGLVDLVIDGGRGDQDAPGDEFSAMIADLVGNKLPQDHPTHFAAVGQFQD